MRLYLLPLILVVCGTALSALAEMSVPMARQEFVAQIDFDALHNQANTALEQLRQSQDRRMTSESVATF
ncbi:MAG: hypothetical protein HY244_17455 [Rhizobiales bacterium]|nr:hypothetical protein [Hyphomicrobiales bacterium]